MNELSRYLSFFNANFILDVGLTSQLNMFHGDNQLLPPAPRHEQVRLGGQEVSALDYTFAPAAYGEEEGGEPHDAHYRDMEGELEKKSIEGDELQESSPAPATTAPQARAERGL